MTIRKIYIKCIAVNNKSEYNNKTICICTLSIFKQATRFTEGAVRYEVKRYGKQIMNGVTIKCTNVMLQNIPSESKINKSSQVGEQSALVVH